MKKLFEILKDIKPSDKVIIFSHFIGMLKMIEHDLIQNNIKCVVSLKDA